MIRLLLMNMASAQFSPPELLKYKFGKKSDVWAMGIIIYLVFLGKNYYKAGADKIFLNANLEKLQKNIDEKTKNLLYNLKKFGISIQDYNKLKKLFQGIFRIDYKERLSSKNLYNILFF